MHNRILAKNRNKDAPPLTFNFPPTLCLDQGYCEALSEELCIIGQEWEILPATPETYQRIPDQCGIYLFVWNPHFKLRSENGNHDLRQVLYVGKANATHSTLRSRYKQEYSKIIHSDLAVFWSSNDPKNREERLKKYLNLDVLEYWFLAVENTTAIIDDLESDLIKLLLPPANSHSKNRVIRAKPEKPKTAF